MCIRIVSLELQKISIQIKHKQEKGCSVKVYSHTVGATKRDPSIYVCDRLDLLGRWYSQVARGTVWMSLFSKWEYSGNPLTLTAGVKEITLIYQELWVTGVIFKEIRHQRVWKQ